MFVNMHMKNFNLNNFQNLCRACMSENELEKLQDGHMKVLNLISKVQYTRTDELPQKICANCVKKINDIMSFALLCKRIDQTLKKYLENLKIENLELNLSTLSPVKTEEITIVEEKIEFIDVNEQIDMETNYVKQELEKIKEELIKAEQSGTPAAKPRPFQCRTCLRTFTYRSTLRSHHRLVHAPSTRYKCDICGKGYALASTLKQHKAGHKQAHCRRCRRSFMTEENLKMHEKLHEKEKPYECLICFKTFYFLKTYLKHNAVHGTEPPTFQCDECDMSFPVAGSLARHKRVHKRDQCRNKNK